MGGSTLWDVVGALLALGLAWAVVVLRRRARAAAAARDALIRRGAVISEAVRSLTRLHSADEVLQAAVRVAADLISPTVPDGRRALYLVVDGDQAHVAAEYDETGQHVPSPVALADHPELAQVVATGQPVVTTFQPYRMGPTARRALEHTQVTHGAAVPITLDGALQGVLAVGGRGRPIAEFDGLVDLGLVVELALANALVTQELAQQATTDPLTGCANRRGLEAAARVMPSREPFAVVAADVDGLKDLNDRQGHEAGDEALVRFAQVAEGVLRAGDVLARVGGDEFVALLHTTDLAAGERIGRRLLDAVRAADGVLPVSLGLASDEHPEHFGDTWARADRAMYRAKSLGGMGLQVADPEG